MQKFGAFLFAFLVTLVTAGAGFSASLDGLSVDVKNETEPVLCAEKDNVAVAFSNKDVRSFRIEAAHPVYLAAGMRDNYEADWTACDMSAGPSYVAPGQPRKVTLYEETEEPNRFLFETEGNYCKVTGPDGDVTLALFIPIGRERWIVQGDEASPTYMIMRRSGDRLRQYLPRCQDYSASRLRRLGITFDGERRYCTVTEASQVETLFRSAGGRMMGAYRRVREDR